MSHLRQNYTHANLTEAEISPDPLVQFERWFEQALTAEFYEVNAMTLATVSPEGQPSARMVLLKGFDARGFVFYTNYHSRKARELAENPQVALVFWWDKLERQIRIEGRAAKIPPAESDAYFASRPRGSQLGAWVSEQSQPIAGRAVLEEQQLALEAEYAGRDIPRPAHWGGYRVEPQAFDFWQGRPSRLHDRFRYERNSAGGWDLVRLAP
jgi:pyridoxamine 5'-phosphate oxidase